MLVGKRSEVKMDREEIYEMVIREMTETAVRELEDVKKAITDYVEATLLAADHDCLYLYEQGAKDCVALLKKLGVL